MSIESEVLELYRGYEQKIRAVSVRNLRQFVVGVDKEVPLLGGRSARYVNLDNAATTPPLVPMLECQRQFFEWYASVHRGSGFKSLLSTYTYEKCRQQVADFVGADLSYHSVIFTQNATHALNKLASRLCPLPGQTVLTTEAEHHSNILPWRKAGCALLYADASAEDGALDMADLERKVRSANGRLKLVTVTGASNVTGILPPIRRIARLAHEHDAMIAIDGAQLVPHRPFQIGAPDDPERVDFLAFSGHKMYAPFGSGVLIGPKQVFQQGWPDMVGGGTVNAVTMDEVWWAAPPESDEAGTPNVLGAIALACAARLLETVGREELAEHERMLTRRALHALSRIEGLRFYGPADHDLRQDRLGVVTFNAERYDHAHLAAILGHEWGIGVRNGCFCAQPYVRKLLGVSAAQMDEIVGKLAAGDHASVPGMVRVSLAMYNTAEEIEYLAEALKSILSRGPRARYVLDKRYLDYVPDTLPAQFDDYAPF